MKWSQIIKDTVTWAGFISGVAVPLIATGAWCYKLGHDDGRSAAYTTISAMLKASIKKDDDKKEVTE